MRPAFRIALLIGATLCAALVALFGGSFSLAVEPHNPASGLSAFWLFTGLAVAAPFWVSTLIPSRYPNVLRRCRKACALGLLLLGGLFGSIVVHHLQRGLSAFAEAPHPAFVQGAVLTLSCLGGLLILLWPERRR
ncbi:hypothetical protein GCM10025771_09000 [Niveibacterium umoris]|uniref:Uncharacterized protein n=1 Tax=Niveibacterium umoris TaxID=1193620 RepID=A0A840BJ29_9RHOO|nr:hypothetical protein [Niveibacterium umoris]MBB4013551.1 hypothetical protein [Niveibacterium umoris]